MDKTKKERFLVNKISDEILEVANLYNEVTTSDLQGVAEATAQRIIKMIREA